MVKIGEAEERGGQGGGWRLVYPEAREERCLLFCSSMFFFPPFLSGISEMKFVLIGDKSD